MLGATGFVGGFEEDVEKGDKLLTEIIAFIA